MSSHSRIFIINLFLKDMSVPSLFAIIEPGLYRSNAITEHHFPFISKLHLKTVIYLSPDIPSRSLSNFYETQHINVVWFTYFKTI